MKSFLVTLLLPLTIFAQTSIEKGKTYIDSKQFAKAEQELSAYVTYHSANLEAIELLGDAYGHQKNGMKLLQNIKSTLGFSRIIHAITRHYWRK